MVKNRLTSCVTILIAFIGIGCPQPDPPLPPTLSAPRNLSGTDTVRPISSRIAEVIHLTWDDPENDSVGIGTYHLIRYLPGDTQPQEILLPATAHTFTERVSLLPFKRSGPDNIVYRLYTIDEYERNGDTAPACTVSVLSLPVIQTPADTVGSNFFAWTLPQASSLYTSLSLFRGTTRFYSFDDPTPHYTGGADASYEFKLPGALYDTLPSTFTLVVGIRDASGAGAAYTVQECHVKQP